MQGDTGTLTILGAPAGKLKAWTVRFAMTGATLEAAGSFVTAFKGAGSARAALVSSGERPSPRSPGVPSACLTVEGKIQELTPTRLVLTNVREVKTEAPGLLRVSDLEG